MGGMEVIPRTERQRTTARRRTRRWSLRRRCRATVREVSRRLGSAESLI